MPMGTRSSGLVLLLNRAAQQYLTPHKPKKKINCLVEKSYVLIIMLKILKCENVKTSVLDMNLMFWLSLNFSLWHLCGDFGVNL